MPPVDPPPRLTQKKLNGEIVRLLLIFIEIIQDSGYRFSPGMDETRGHAHVRIASTLHTILSDIRTLEREAREAELIPLPL